MCVQGKTGKLLRSCFITILRRSSSMQISKIGDGKKGRPCQFYGRRLANNGRRGGRDRIGRLRMLMCLIFSILEKLIQLGFSDGDFPKEGECMYPEWSDIVAAPRCFKPKSEFVVYELQSDRSAGRPIDRRLIQLGLTFFQN